MIRVGSRPPLVRIPALAGGTLRYVALHEFRHRWVLLCFLPQLTLADALRIAGQAGFGPSAESSADLIAVGDDGALLTEDWAHHAALRDLVLGADPIGRLHRAFGVAWGTAPRRCHSFVIDPEGMLQFFMVHELRGHGLGTLAEILKAGFTRSKRGEDLESETHT
ncbi:hypothetical protein [Candidatus Nitrospira bockiana]